MFGREMPGAHTAIGDVEGLEGVLSAPGISGRWVHSVESKRLVFHGFKVTGRLL